MLRWYVACSIFVRDAVRKKAAVLRWICLLACLLAASAIPACTAVIFQDALREHVHVLLPTDPGDSLNLCKLQMV